MADSVFSPIIVKSTRVIVAIVEEDVKLVNNELGPKVLVCYGRHRVVSIVVFLRNLTSLLEIFNHEQFETNAWELRPAYSIRFD